MFMLMFIINLNLNNVGASASIIVYSSSVSTPNRELCYRIRWNDIKWIQRYQRLTSNAVALYTLFLKYKNNPRRNNFYFKIKTT